MFRSKLARGIAAASLLALSLPAAVQTPAVVAAGELKDAFVAHVAAGMTDYSVCEHFSKREDKVAAMVSRLKVELATGQKGSAAKEVFVRKEGEAGHLHLGILALDYATEDRARQVSAELGSRGKYLKSGKILTGFTAIRRGALVLILYSETFLDPSVKAFFAAEAAKSAR